VQGAGCRVQGAGQSVMCKFSVHTKNELSVVSILNSVLDDAKTTSTIKSEKSYKNSDFSDSVSGIS
jgi:hypothetical protein